MSFGKYCKLQKTHNIDANKQVNVFTDKKIL